MKLHRLFIILILAVGVTGCGLTVSDYDDAVMDGIASLNLNKPDKALDSFERAIRIDPKPATGYLGRANALNTLGLALAAQNRLDEAVETFRRALALQNDLADAQINLADVYRRQGQTTQPIVVVIAELGGGVGARVASLPGRRGQGQMQVRRAVALVQKLGVTRNRI